MPRSRDNRPHTVQVAFTILMVMLATIAHVATQTSGLRDGVYTEEQATRGKMQYTMSCGACHQAGLQGSDLAPPLKGDDFVLKWSGFTLQDLYDKIATTMPGDAPGSLMPQTNADILAYVLQVNKFPPGKGELKADVAALKAIPIEPPSTAR